MQESHRPMDHMESALQNEEAKSMCPASFARALRISEAALAEVLGVELDTLQRRSRDPQVQERLKPFVSVHKQLLMLQSDAGLAADHMKATPIRHLGHRTLLEVVRGGEAAKAMRYLQTLSSVWSERVRRLLSARVKKVSDQSILLVDAKGVAGQGGPYAA